MKPIDIDKLEVRAHKWQGVRTDEFSPEVVLALIDRVRTAEAALQAIIDTKANYTKTDSDGDTAYMHGMNAGQADMQAIARQALVAIEKEQES